MSDAAWPNAVFQSPVLRGFDATARQRLAAAGTLADIQPGESVFAVGDLSDAFFAVIHGEISVEGRTPSGDRVAVRVVRQGDTFGEDAALIGGRRKTDAVARVATQVARIPVAIFRRLVSATDGGGGLAAQEEAFLRRRAAADLLRSMPAGQQLRPEDVDALLDTAQHEHVPRGTPIYSVGERAHAIYIVARGLVEHHVPSGDGHRVRAYLGPGDIFGHRELLANAHREVAAVAMGPSDLLVVDATVFRGIAARNPSFVQVIAGLADERNAIQRAAVATAAHENREHPFRDLYRLHTATSLLVIDQDSCVRCGHCTWTCAATHGTARFVRRGEKVVASTLGPGDVPESRPLLIPNACQHCDNPVCMQDCPTGAIVRRSGGEVAIREPLCTGCGNCAKACPWDNIRIAPRAARASVDPILLNAPKAQGKTPLESYPEVAVKCDVCADLSAPACVQACPVEAIQRIRPTETLVDVAKALGTTPQRSSRPARRGGGIALAAAVVALGGGAAAATMHARGLWTPERDVGYALGWVAAIGMFGLAGYAVPKRVVALWQRRRGTRSPKGSDRHAPRSTMRPRYVAHLAVGYISAAAVIGHAGLRVPPNLTGALQVLLWTTVLLGVFGTGVYRSLPARLTRLERRGVLPEELRKERDLLLDRLYRGLSGQSDGLKSVAAKVLLPYARSTAGAMGLIVRGRSLDEEERRLQAAATAQLPPQSDGSHEALAPLVRTCVELRALPARRWLTLALRAWLPVHLVLGALSLVALVGHIIFVSTRA